MTDTLFPVTVNIDLNQLQAALTALGSAPPPPPPPAPTVPGAPTIGTATVSGTTGEVAFTAPASNGGSPITHYVATSSPGGISNSGSASPIAVPGLTDGTAYDFQVTAVNAVGSSAPSAASNSVTPGTVVTPPAGAWDGTILDSNGNLNKFWNPATTGLANQVELAGDWNSAGSMTFGVTAPDGGLAALWNPSAPDDIWIPHPIAFKNAPSQNGIAIPLWTGFTGDWSVEPPANPQLFTKYSMDVCFPVSGGEWSMIANGVAGYGKYVGPDTTTTDVALTGSNVLGTNLAVGKFVTLTISTTTLNTAASAAANVIYKMMQQQQTGAKQCYIRNSKFS